MIGVNIYNGASDCGQHATYHHKVSGESLEFSSSLLIRRDYTLYVFIAEKPYFIYTLFIVSMTEIGCVYYVLFSLRMNFVSHITNPILVNT